MEAGSGPRPRIGISRCLLGARVRYDGGHKLDDCLIDGLGPYVEWVDICPEVEAGMGVPREPVSLVAGGPSQGPRGVRMLAVRSGRDWTVSMTEWSAAKVRDLASIGLAGYVLKARSPSCGLRDVPVHAGTPAAPPSGVGRGVFADALLAAFPGLPVADEEQLHDRQAQREFLARVLEYSSGSGR